MGALLLQQLCWLTSADDCLFFLCRAAELSSKRWSPFAAWMTGAAQSQLPLARHNQQLVPGRPPRAEQQTTAVLLCNAHALLAVLRPSCDASLQDGSTFWARCAQYGDEG